ncbi:hypothetical protein LCGC14_1623990 [marine sediment metagenome]|uniref:Uncharacterized protein n=1 Tax=marine sediment metagenome TaxID=412755 RepID=A0A0F9L4A2_9ZZZZ
MIPVQWLEKIHDKEAFLNAIDDDWKEKFMGDHDLALDFFTVMDHTEFQRAIKESQ